MNRLGNIEKYEEAIKYCLAAIKIDNKAVKAYF